jgi:flagellar FliJ protein
MSKALIKTLGLAIELAVRQRDAASQALAQTQQRRMAAEQQLGQLTGYAQETEQRWESQARIHTMPELLQHHQRFMGRLEEAIVLQRRVVAEQLRRQEMARQVLLQAELRVATLEQAVRRKQAVLDLAETRREQRQTDEMAAVRHALGVRQRAEEQEYGY